MMPKDGQLTTEKLHEIRKRAAKQFKLWGWSYELAAQKCATNPTYISNFVNGKFGARDIPAGTLQKLARTVNEVIEFAHRRKLRERRLAFVRTCVARRMIKGTMHGIETCDVVLMHGPTGCGKSVTLVELVTLIPAMILISLTSDQRHRTGLLRALYSAVWGHAAPARPRLSDIVERLKHSDRLLALDNADLLGGPDCYQVIMDLHDTCHVPVLLVGTHRLLQRMMFDNDPLRGQMSSRIGMRIELLSEQTSPRKSGRAAEWIRADEIRQIFESAQVKLHPAAVARLKAIANFEIGRLRRCEKVMKYAELLAPRQSGQVVITEQVLEQAIALVSGDAVAPASPSPEPLEATA